MIHYLDDFFFNWPCVYLPDRDVCADNLENAKLLCLELGVLLAPDKTIEPSTIMPCLVIELDSVEFEAHLPLFKLFKAEKISFKMAFEAFR